MRFIKVVVWMRPALSVCDVYFLQRIHRFIEHTAATATTTYSKNTQKDVGNTNKEKRAYPWMEYDVRSLSSKPFDCHITVTVCVCVL